jgi:hypothetical protein
MKVNTIIVQAPGDDEEGLEPALLAPGDDDGSGLAEGYGEASDGLIELRIGEETFRLVPAVNDHISSLVQACTDAKALADGAEGEKASLERDRETFAQERCAFDALLSGDTDGAALAAIDSVLGQFQALDWAAAARSDPAWAQGTWDRYGDMLKAREGVAAQVAACGQARSAWEAQAQARAAKRALAELSASVSGWSEDTPAAMAAFAASEFGFSPEEVSGVTDGRLLKLLYRTYAAQVAAAKLARAKAGQATTPAVALSAGRAGGDVAGDTDDFAAFERMANAKLASRAKVLRVIG